MVFYRCLVEKRLIKRCFQGITTFTGKVRSSLDYKIAKIAWKKLSMQTKVVGNQVMFFTYQDKYTDNQKYLCEELIASGFDGKIVWVYSDKTGNELSQFPKEVTLVKFGTFDYYKAMASSKFWIDNAHNCTWEGFPKKDEQIYINTWHGSMGLKKINAEVDTNRNRRRAGKRANKITNYCISNSKFEEMVFNTTYWPDVEYLRYGHCRNDILFATDDIKSKLKAKVCRQFGIDTNKKILLYAPTFRDGNNLEYLDIDYKRLKEALEEKFGGEWVIFSRFHFHVLLKHRDKVVNLRSGMDYVFVADDYNDMQELLAISDIGITDYSSWICDYVLTGKPGFLYTTDIESYVTERGFYYPLEDTPFPICKNNDELIHNIKVFDQNEYNEKTIKYLKGLGCAEDGNASKRLVELINQKKENK